MTAQHIWYISKYISTPSDGGPGARGFELMRELVSMGVDCTIFAGSPNHLAPTPSFRGSHMVEHVDGVRICWIKTISFKDAKSLKRIASWIHFEFALLVLRKRHLPPPDTIVASSLSLFSVISGLILRTRYGSRLVFEVRDIWPLTIVEEGGFSRNNPFVWMLGRIERLGYKHADVIVGTMPNLGEHVENVLGHPRHTDCVPMGIASRITSQCDPLPVGYRETYLDHSGFTIGYAGTVGITNALEPFLLAAEAMRDDPRYQFVLVGDGGLLPAYQAQYSHLPNLTFAPKVARGAVQNVLEEFDLLYLSVHKSRVWDFGMSLNKLIDYMLAAKPVIASYDGFQSMINEAGCGSFVPAGSVADLVDEIARYAAMSSDQRHDVGQRGRQWLLKHRTYEALAKNYLSICSSG